MSDIQKWLEQYVSFRSTPNAKDKTEKKEESSVNIEEPSNINEIKEEMEGKELEDQFKKQVEVAAYFLSRAGYSYDDLCWFLAEKILKESYQLGKRLSISELSCKAEEIHYKGLHYDELCWLNGEMDIIIKKYFDK